MALKKKAHLGRHGTDGSKDSQRNQMIKNKNS